MNWGTKLGTRRDDPALIKIMGGPISIWTVRARATSFWLQYKKGGGEGEREGEKGGSPFVTGKKRFYTRPLNRAKRKQNSSHGMQKGEVGRGKEAHEA